MTDETGERPIAVEKDQTSLEVAVTRLRVLEEENARTIRLIAEGHGARFDSLSATLDARFNEVMKALEPMQQIRDFIERVADDHELRITALEKHTNLRE